MPRARCRWILMTALCATSSLAAGCRDAEPPPNSDARAVVQRAIEAHGGMETWHELRDVTWRETVRRFREPVGTTARTIYLKKPRHGNPSIRIEQDGGFLEHVDAELEVIHPPISGLLVVGSDGTDVWYEIDGRPDTSEDALRTARYVTQAFFYWFSLPFKLLDQGVRLRLLAPVTRYGKSHPRVEVTFDPGTGDTPTDGFIYMFDPESGRITDFEYWRVGRTHRPRLAFWRDYVQVGGLWKESLRIYLFPETMVTNTERRFEYLAVNSDLPDSLFRPGYQLPSSP